MTRKLQKHILADCFPPLPRLPKVGSISIQEKKKNKKLPINHSLLPCLNPACPSVLFCTRINFPHTHLATKSLEIRWLLCIALLGLVWDADGCCRSWSQGCSASVSAGETCPAVKHWPSGSGTAQLPADGSWRSQRCCSTPVRREIWAFSSLTSAACE